MDQLDEVWIRECAPLELGDVIVFFAHKHNTPDLRLGLLGARLGERLVATDEEIR